MVWLPDGEKTLMICLAVLIKYQCVKRYAYALRGKNCDFQPIFRFIKEMIQDRAMEGEYETVPRRSNGTSLNDLEWLEKYSMTRSIARSLCDSWASCYFVGRIRKALTICAWSPVATVLPPAHVFHVYPPAAKYHTVSIQWSKERPLDRLKGKLL